MRMLITIFGVLALMLAFTPTADALVLGRLFRPRAPQVQVNNFNGGGFGASQQINVGGFNRGFDRGFNRGFNRGAVQVNNFNGGASFAPAFYQQRQFFQAPVYQQRQFFQAPQYYVPPVRFFQSPAYQSCAPVLAVPAYQSCAPVQAAPACGAAYSFAQQPYSAPAVLLSEETTTAPDGTVRTLRQFR